MAKTEKTADIIENVEFPAFDTSKATDQFRAFAEKGADQSREAFAKVKAGAEEAQKLFESTVETARTASNELSLKAIAAFRANAELGFSHLESLLAAKSLSELVELQAAYLRKRVEMAVGQVKEFQSATTKAAEDVAQPFKGAFDKALNEFKAA
ncbi:MAG TPA: phasin [Rhizobiaceae bacterium]|nr:phasin [Rhizobiaceae bacterium]